MDKCNDTESLVNMSSLREIIFFFFFVFLDVKAKIQPYYSQNDIEHNMEGHAYPVIPTAGPGNSNDSWFKAVREFVFSALHLL